MKKQTLLAAGLALALLLAACGGKPAPSGPQGGASSAAVSGSGQQPKPTGEAVTQQNLRDFPVTDAALFTTEQAEGGVSIRSCEAEDAVIVVPETIGGQTVAAVSYGAFAMMEMEGLVLPDTVKTIAKGAFDSCEKLKYIELGAGLESIGELAFNQCGTLQSVTFPDTLTAIKSYLFNGCGALGDVYIPASVVSIPNGLADPESCPNLVVVTPAGSAAEKAAAADGIALRNS